MTTHRITISTLATSNSRADLASCGEFTARSARSCAARALARLMVSAGVEDGPVEARGTDGALRYTMKSLHNFAKFTISENPRPHTVRWVDMREIYGNKEDSE